MAVYKSNTSSGRGNVRRNTSAPVAPVPSQIPPVANPVGKARAIANRGKTPIEKARATVAPIIQPPTIPAPEPTTKQPFGCGTPGAGEWGLAAAKNAAMREGNRIYDPKLKQVVVKELPFYFVNIVIPPRPGAAPVLTTMPCPNPNYIAEAPPTPTPDPEKPTKTIIEEIVDKIIADSEETVKEIVIKQEPVREPVIPVQDIVQPPPPITPVEKTRISSVLQEAASESFLQYLFISFKPSSPVPAFALPELTIRYLGQYLFIFSFDIITDGDFALFFVKTPAIFEPQEISKIDKSSLFLAYIPE